ncbi:hypothetical protein PAE9249_00191 [Paenibacillus sp. CECT 9249]|nr:hypothetical protein PAE9249_00191 [Paenibacillus sp. CECT 9249]
MTKRYRSDPIRKQESRLIALCFIIALIMLFSIIRHL